MEMGSWIVGLVSAALDVGRKVTCSAVLWQLRLSNSASAGPRQEAPALRLCGRFSQPISGYSVLGFSSVRLGIQNGPCPISWYFGCLATGFRHLEKTAQLGDNGEKIFHTNTIHSLVNCHCSRLSGQSCCSIANDAFHWSAYRLKWLARRLWPNAARTALDCVLGRDLLSLLYSVTRNAGTPSLAGYSTGWLSCRKCSVAVSPMLPLLQLT